MAALLAELGTSPPRRDAHCRRTGRPLNLFPEPRDPNTAACGNGPSRCAATPQYCLHAAYAAYAVGKRLLPDRSCLTQALVLQCLLLRRGDDSLQLQIGVTEDEGQELQAHVWGEDDGRVLIGGADAPEMYERFKDLETEIGSSNAPKRPS